MVANPTGGQLNRKMKFSLFQFASENSVSRDRFRPSRPAAARSSILRLKLELTNGVQPAFPDGVP